MALETVVYPQDNTSTIFSCSIKNLLSVSSGLGFPGSGHGVGCWGYFDHHHLPDMESAIHDHRYVKDDYYNHQYLPYSNYSSPDQNLRQGPAHEVDDLIPPSLTEPPAPARALFTATSGSSSSRRKRRRCNKSMKDKEQMENQRMTHIVVERNRRKQMNHYLALLRSLMPSSYVQRGDQASIIGGAINFVKELEQHLQFIQAHKYLPQPLDHHLPSDPFAEFFTFPQYSTRATTPPTKEEKEVEPPLVAADIEVTMSDSHANLKIQSRKQPKQLLKLVVGLQSLRLSVLHLNVTTTPDQMVMYSFSVKVEEECQLSTMDDIAAAVNQMLHAVNQEEVTIS